MKSTSIKKIIYRSYHFIAGAAIKCVPFPKQEIITDSKNLTICTELLLKQNINSVFIASSRSVHRNGLLDDLLTSLIKENIKYAIYEDIGANPTISNVENGLKIFKANNCKAIIMVGGGSPMDCAKAIGLRVACPNLSYKDMRSMLKITHRIPYTIAIPTTAGTGSESTVAAVISDPQNQDKYAIVSPFLMPHAVILDGSLTLLLSPQYTAYTGMDALTHAIEAYIGIMDTRASNIEALNACKLIFDNLEIAYNDSSNIKARNAMLLASNKAGFAFTRVYVGYVHAISHALSAMYNLGHGLTNAIILPYILEYYGSSIYKKMGEIARFSSIGPSEASDKELTEILIAKIKEMNNIFSIPDHIEEIKEADIEIIVKKALHEANPGYPVPKIMEKKDCTQILRDLKQSL